MYKVTVVAAIGPAPNGNCRLAEPNNALAVVLRCYVVLCWYVVLCCYVGWVVLCCVGWSCAGPPRGKQRPFVWAPPRWVLLLHNTFPERGSSSAIR